MAVGLVILFDHAIDHAIDHGVDHAVDSVVGVECVFESDKVRVGGIGLQAFQYLYPNTTLVDLII